MSVTPSKELVLVAQHVARELRKTLTPAERIFWEYVRGRKFHGFKFYRQFPLYVDLDGRNTFFVADFYCHERKLVVEIDGRLHDYHRHHDEARTEAINDLRISVIRFKNEEIEGNIEGVLRKLKAKIQG